jgi:hypothetical protein
VALALLAPRLALAGGAEGGGAPRVVEETSLVVWDQRTGVEHLLVAARVDQLKGRGLYVYGLPPDAVEVTGPGSEALVKAFAFLSPEAPPLPFAAGSGRRVEGPSFAATCPDLLGAPCGPAALNFARGRAVGVLGITAPDEGGSATSTYHHTRFVTPAPILPFAEPAAPSDHDEPPAPSEDHPPRVNVWVELGNETKAGQWERQIDQAAAAQAAVIGECYAKVLEKSRRLAGDVHVQMRIAKDGAVSDEEERASSAPLESTARCAAGKLAKASWPGNPFGRPVRFEVHAQLLPPRALRRVSRVLVLSSTDAVPRLGSSDRPRPVPELKEIRSEEPDPSLIWSHLDEPSRKELGLDPHQRWRLLVFETTMDPHGENDDLALLTLAPLPPTRPGDPPVPIITRGDRPTVAAPPHAPRWWHRRRVHLGIIGLFVLLIVVIVIWNDRRGTPTRDTDA